MLFKPELIAEIKAGRKTQTRRVVKPGETALRATDDHVYYTEIPGKFSYTGLTTSIITEAVYDANSRIKWQVGRVYAICPGRGKPGVGFIRLTAIQQERVQDIRDAGALAEGFPPDWIPWDTQELVLTFPREWYRLTWDAINTRKGTRWQDNPDVWVLTFEYVGEMRP